MASARELATTSPVAGDDAIRWYQLRTIGTGLLTTLLTLVVLIAYLLLPGDSRLQRGPYVLALLAAAAGAVVIALLPWRGLFKGPWGIRLFYAWSVLDIVLISVVVAVSGGVASRLEVLYALTTVFFVASYPVRAQLGLFIVTCACYLVALRLAGGAPSAREVVTTLAVLGVLALLAGILYGEAREHILTHLALATSNSALTERLHHAAFHDTLTDLANRSLFRERVEQALSAHTAEDLVAVLFVDLDDFKGVNDGLGHPAGDALLKATARRLLSCVRSGDTVARLGGDEFAILLCHTTQLEALAVGERAVAAVQAPVALCGTVVSVAASVGVAIGRPPLASADALLRDADLAMYAAKADGKGRCRGFEPAMHARAMERLQLKADLGHALERGQMQVRYQPILDLGSNAVIGVEALARWRYPTRGLLSADEFIPLAEESDAINELGRWVLGEACRQVRRWEQLRPEHPPLTVSVNVSGRQLGQADFVAEVVRVLEDSDLEPGRLVLEVTDSVLIGGGERVNAKLLTLRELGVRLTLDDVDSGYSVLWRLPDLPIDGIKLKRLFVDGIGQGVRQSAAPNAIVQLAVALDLEVIAEGITSTVQVPELLALGCRLGQGFHFAEAVEPDELLPLLDAETRPRAGERR